MSEVKILPFVDVSVPPAAEMVRVTFLPEGKTVEFPFGSMPYEGHGEPMSFLDVAENFDIFLDHACGGVCACTTCHLWVKQGASGVSEAEDKELDRMETAADIQLASRLGCQAIIEKPGVYVVEIPKWNRNYVQEGKPVAGGSCAGLWEGGRVMMKTAIATTAAPAAIGPYSQAIRVGDMLFTSGQIPTDPATGNFVAGGITEQTRQVLENLKAILAQAGVDLTHVVKTTVFLKDMKDFAAMNAVYGTYLAAEGMVPPARSTVQVAALPKDALVEIEVIAKDPE